jgi:hypothetical protein
MAEDQTHDESQDWDNHPYYVAAKKAFDEMFNALSEDEQSEWWDDDEWAWINEYIWELNNGLRRLDEP